MRRSRHFPLDALSVAAARRFTNDALVDIPADQRQAVELMVSELATNCIRHAQTGFQLALFSERQSVRVEVTDLASGVPAVQSPGPLDPSGRGLAIVELLSDAWGVEFEGATDKTVWFTVGWAGPRRESFPPAPATTYTERPRSAPRLCAARGS